jgi:carbon storage regulator
MLVLSRKLGEKVVVPAHDIIIKVLEIRGNKVRLGIAAPSDTEVFRHEVWERLHSFRSDELGDGDVLGDAPAAAGRRDRLPEELARSHGRGER